MSKVTLTARPSNLRRVNLTRFVVFISRYPSGSGMNATAYPSEAYLNSDGTLSVSSRLTDSGFSRVSTASKVYFGVTKDTNELVEITFD